MNTSFTQERKLIYLTRLPISVTSKQEMKKYAKLRNTPTFFTHIVMRTIQGISLTYAQSPPQFTYLTSPSLDDAPGKSMKTP